MRTVDGPREERCGEPGRVVDDEVGPYEPSWASFLESPPFAHLQRPEGDWQPVLPRAGQIGSCR